MPQQSNCAYCGQYDIMTRDHVIPQCLFPEELPLPGDIPKVYACESCNNKKKSADDAYLRDILVTNKDSSTSPIARRNFSKFDRAVERNQSQLAKDLHQFQFIELHAISSVATGPILVDSGIRLKILEAFAIGKAAPEGIIGLVTSQRANERSIRILSTITRGLYNYYTGIIFPANAPIAIRRAWNLETLKQQMQLLYDAGAPFIRIGDGSVFELTYKVDQAEPNDSAWILNFYRRVQFVIVTGSLPTQEAGEDSIAS